MTENVALMLDARIKDVLSALSNDKSLNARVYEKNNEYAIVESSFGQIEVGYDLKIDVDEYETWISIDYPADGAISAVIRALSPLGVDIRMSIDGGFLESVSVK